MKKLSAIAASVLLTTATAFAQGSGGSGPATTNQGGTDSTDAITRPASNMDTPTRGGSVMNSAPSSSASSTGMNGKHKWTKGSNANAAAGTTAGSGVSGTTNGH